MKLPCSFKDYKFLDNKIVYICEFKEQTIPEDTEIELVGASYVGGVLFRKCNLIKVPQGLTKMFPNIKILSIWDSTLKIVTKEDLAEYKNIERIGFVRNEIEYLPGDLFEGFNRLEEISFAGNKLELIEPNILDGLNSVKLRMVDFKENPNYSKCFSNFPNVKSNATLQEVKDELFVKFYTNHKNVKELLKLRDENLLVKKVEACKNMQLNLKKFMQNDESLKDFEIQINDEKFTVHKILLAARSPTFAEIISNNPEIENLNLIDIPVDIFKKILHFLYTDEYPIEGTNFVDLFAAAGRLKIKELIEHAAQELIKIISTENALNILKLSNKYDHNKLREAAFKQIKKDYPKIEFKNEWSRDVKTVIKFIDAFNLKVEMIKKIEEDFENMVKNG